MAYQNILNDLPTLKDCMGWEKEITRIKDRLLYCPSPHVFGIHGNWGSGKTSFMRQLQFNLGGELPNYKSVIDCASPLPIQTKNRLQNQVVTVWFDAWRYQNELYPVVALS